MIQFGCVVAAVICKECGGRRVCMPHPACCCFLLYCMKFGMADSRESYIHRLGRTGRAGKQGEGLLVLSDLEVGFLNQLNDIDIPLNKDMQRLLDMPTSSSLGQLQPILSSIRNGKNTDLINAAESAYRAMLGFYNGKLKRVGGKGASSSTETLVDFANGWALQAGLKEIPGIELRTIRKMGLENAPGLRIEKNNPTAKRPPNNSAGGHSAPSPPLSHSSKDNNNRDGLGAAPGKSNGRQQRPRNNNGRKPASASGLYNAAVVDLANNARPPRNLQTDDTRKRPKQDSESAQKRPKEDRQQQQPSARNRAGSSSSGGPKSKSNGGGQRWESTGRSGNNE